MKEMCWYVTAIVLIVLAVGLAGMYSPAEDAQEKTYCTPESREGEMCIQLYDPVCGWFKDEIKCVKHPCAQTYSNSCFACQDEKVKYWTKGECPN